MHTNWMTFPHTSFKKCVHPRITPLPSCLPFIPQESKKTSSKRDLDEYDDLNDDSKPAPATKSLKTASTSTAGKSPLQQPQHSHQKSQPLSQKQQQPRLLSPHSGTSAAVNRKPHTALTHGASLLAGGRGGIPHGSKSTGNAQQSASKGSLHNPGRVVGSSNGAGQVAGFRPSNGSTQGLQGKQSSAGQRLQGTGARMPMQGNSRVICVPSGFDTSQLGGIADDFHQLFFILSQTIYPIPDVQPFPPST